MRIAIVINASWNIYNFRLGLLRALAQDGHEVVALAPHDSYSKRIPFEYHPIVMHPQSLNPIKEIGVFCRLVLAYRRIKPELVLHFTPKPNIYGSLAAKLLGIDSISNVAGLGRVFTRESWLRSLLEFMYRHALSGNRKVFFQNREDLAYFVKRGLVQEGNARRIPGSGIDLQRFKGSGSASGSREIRFILVSRMLWEKGVGDFVEAARIAKKRGLGSRFQLLGFLEKENPSAVSRQQMDAWVDEGIVEYLGETDDVRIAVNQADCVVLPSIYREGVPRTLLEAAALSKPIIAYENVGARDVIEHGRNGFLVPIKDVAALADAFETFAAMDPQSRVSMGAQGRAKVEKEFDEKLVLDAYRRAIADLMAG